MSAFSRIAGIALLIVSFCLIVGALPSPRADDAAWVITGKDPLCVILAKFFIDVRACIDVIAQCQDIVALKANILILVTLCNNCAAQLLKIGVNVKVTAEAQESIVACFAAMISLLVKVLLAHCVKFGTAAVITVCVELDVCLHLLLKNLDVCIKGVVALIVNACATAVVGVFAQLKLKLCLALFASIGL